MGKVVVAVRNIGRGRAGLNILTDSEFIFITTSFREDEVMAKVAEIPNATLLKYHEWEQYRDATFKERPPKREMKFKDYLDEVEEQERERIAKYYQTSTISGMLRERAEHVRKDGMTTLALTMNLGADRIETLTAQVEQLREQLSSCRDSKGDQ